MLCVETNVLSACLYDDVFLRSGDLKQPGRINQSREVWNLYHGFTPQKTYLEL